MTRLTTVVNVKTDQCDIYIGRWHPLFPKEPTYKWGNPYKVGRDGTLDAVLEKFEVHLRASADLMQSLPRLNGSRLGCWCVEKPIDFIRPNKVCHGEIYLKVLHEVAAA